MYVQQSFYNFCFIKYICLHFSKVLEKRCSFVLSSTKYNFAQLILPTVVFSTSMYQTYKLLYLPQPLMYVLWEDPIRVATQFWLLKFDCINFAAQKIFTSQYLHFVTCCSYQTGLVFNIKTLNKEVWQLTQNNKNRENQIRFRKGLLFTSPQHSRRMNIKTNKKIIINQSSCHFDILQIRRQRTWLVHILFAMNCRSLYNALPIEQVNKEISLWPK